jgi:putative oxidoreductase
MNMINKYLVEHPTIILRLTLFVILIMHSVPGMFDGGVNNFGELYLNQIGFAPLGVPLAWTIKLSHLFGAILLLANKYIRLVSIVTIAILIMGIILVHYPEGWYVVGGGRNGVEFNVLLISVFLTLIVMDKQRVNQSDNIFGWLFSR